MSIVLAIVVALVALGLGYAGGRRWPGARDDGRRRGLPESASAHRDTHRDTATAEQARLLRSYEGESARLRACVRNAEAAHLHLAALAQDRQTLFGALADAHARTARYRQLVIDIENNAPPPLLGGPGMPDDLKLIVGVGPVLERLLHQLGITTYRQIARWSERDIDEFDARLDEFPGRIRRDAWVTQARALYQSTHGEPPPRERG